MAAEIIPFPGTSEESPEAWACLADWPRFAEVVERYIQVFWPDIDDLKKGIILDGLRNFLLSIGAKEGLRPGAYEEEVLACLQREHYSEAVRKVLNKIMNSAHGAGISHVYKGYEDRHQVLVLRPLRLDKFSGHSPLVLTLFRIAWIWFSEQITPRTLVPKERLVGPDIQDRLAGRNVIRLLGARRLGQVIAFREREDE